MRFWWQQLANYVKQKIFFTACTKASNVLPNIGPVILDRKIAISTSPPSLSHA